MKKSDLKQIIKECLNEISPELASTAGDKFYKREQPKRAENINIAVYGKILNIFKKYPEAFNTIKSEFTELQTNDGTTSPKRFLLWNTVNFEKFITDVFIGADGTISSKNNSPVVFQIDIQKKRVIVSSGKAKDIPLERKIVFMLIRTLAPILKECLSTIKSNTESNFRQRVNIFLNKNSWNFY